MSKYDGHTPGPLRAVEKLSGSENHRGYTVVRGDGTIIANVMPIDEDGVLGKPYAHLFADAPTILAQRDEAVALLRRLRMTGATAMVDVFTKDDIDAFLARIDKEASE
jgi:hypothetical protein